MHRRDADEHEAFRHLFHSTYRPLLAYALRRTSDRSAAEDVVGETLLVAWRRRRAIPGGADALPWLYGVARRVLANHRRATRRRQRLERVLAPLARTRSDPDQAAQLSAATRAVVVASRRLSESDREVLRLAAWEGLGQKQLSLSLGCSENAAALRLHRARKRLREELLKEGWSSGQELVEVAQ